ncbi:MAG: hypothetical protein Q7U91_08940 [Sideroxyarcus sp.]|nr:hypothetical protein [Sideroxyarcus sp.]
MRLLIKRMQLLKSQIPQMDRDVIGNLYAKIKRSVYDGAFATPEPGRVYVDFDRIFQRWRTHVLYAEDERIAMFEWFKKKAAKADAPNGPDFSSIDSRAKAEELFRRGDLAKLYLMPLEFGGADIGPNIVFVPPFAVEMKASIDFNIIKPLADEGKIKHYEAKPEYEGSSFIPSAIKVIASDPGDFSTVIGIWGKGLTGA